MEPRTIPMNPRLAEALAIWKTLWADIHKRAPDCGDYLFPGRSDFAKHLTRRAVDYALRRACEHPGIEGASAHSFRRSALTAASDKGVPLRVIQSISGHSSLEMLQRYLDVKDDQKKQAALAFG